MTRETKIGLLVGLAFIIVVGILLSDHLTNSTEPPQARMTQAGDNVRQSVTTPGTPTDPPLVITPEPVTPQQPVATAQELAPRPQPVQFVSVGGRQQNGDGRPVNIQATQHQQPPVPPASEQPQATAQQQQQPSQTASVPAALAETARQHGQELVSTQNPSPATPGAREYK